MNRLAGAIDGAVGEKMMMFIALNDVIIIVDIHRWAHPLVGTFGNSNEYLVGVWLFEDKAPVFIS